jgi:hypothetical protein
MQKVKSSHRLSESDQVIVATGPWRATGIRDVETPFIKDACGRGLISSMPNVHFQ